MGFFQFGSLFIFVGQKLTKMTKADIVKQLAQETGVEAVTVLAVVEGFMEEVRATPGSVFVGKEKRRKEQVSSSQIFDSLFCICSEQ